VLGLPAEPRLDKGVPFSELRSVAENGSSTPATATEGGRR